MWVLALRPAMWVLALRPLSSSFNRTPLKSHNKTNIVGPQCGFLPCGTQVCSCLAAHNVCYCLAASIQQSRLRSTSAPQNNQRSWCRRPDSNRHGPLGPRDFKSLVSTIPPLRRRHRQACFMPVWKLDTVRNERKGDFGRTTRCGKRINPLQRRPSQNSVVDLR